jgi:hypothetical protein
VLCRILLSATRRITVAAGMADIYARDAVTTAAAQRTLEEAFSRRFLLGLWDSHPSLAEDVRGTASVLPLPPCAPNSMRWTPPRSDRPPQRPRRTAYSQPWTPK